MFGDLSKLVLLLLKVLVNAYFLQMEPNIVYIMALVLLWGQILIFIILTVAQDYCQIIDSIMTT